MVIYTVRGHNTLQPLCLLLIPCDHNAYRSLSLLTATPISSYDVNPFHDRPLRLSVSMPVDLNRFCQQDLLTNLPFDPANFHDFRT